LISGREVRIYIACYFQVTEYYCPIGKNQNYQQLIGMCYSLG